MVNRVIHITQKRNQPPLQSSPSPKKSRPFILCQIQRCQMLHSIDLKSAHNLTYKVCAHYNTPMHAPPQIFPFQSTKLREFKPIYPLPRTIRTHIKRKRPCGRLLFVYPRKTTYSAMIASLSVTSTSDISAITTSLVPSVLIGSASLTIAVSTATPASVSALAMSCAETEP